MPVLSVFAYWKLLTCPFGLTANDGISGPQSPRGPGQRVAIFSNRDRLENFTAEKPIASALPDPENLPHLEHPPFFCDLDIEDAAAKPELRIDVYIGDHLALSKSFSSDPAQDQFFLGAGRRGTDGR